MKAGRTLMYDIASFVIHRGQATVDDAAPSFPGKTKEQLRRAMQNAVSKGLIRCIHSGQQAGVRGSIPGVYGPRDAKPLGASKARCVASRVVVSVFDMEGVSVPTSPGTMHSPLGGWR